MIKFFKKIRQQLLTENKFSKYLIYAIGEIVLVVIGILIALSINNWNENSKRLKTEKQLFENLITSLKKDSTDISQIIDYQSKSYELQNRMINSSISEFTHSLSKEEISENIFILYTGGYSFFPKYGVYSSIVSSKGIDFIKSEKIKSQLIDLYDFQYKRYESIDKILDAKFQDALYPFLSKELKFQVGYNSEYSLINIDDLNNCYSDLQLQCRNLTWQANPSLKLLRNIEKSIDSLLREMENEKNK